MAKVLACGFAVCEFELQLSYCIHFRTHTLRKVMNPPTSSWFNNIAPFTRVALALNNPHKNMSLNKAPHTKPSFCLHKPCALKSRILICWDATRRSNVQELINRHVPQSVSFLGFMNHPRSRSSLYISYL